MWTQKKENEKFIKKEGRVMSIRISILLIDVFIWKGQAISNISKIANLLPLSLGRCKKRHKFMETTHTFHTHKQTRTLWEQRWFLSKSKMTPSGIFHLPLNNNSCLHAFCLLLPSVLFNMLVFFSHLATHTFTQRVTCASHKSELSFLLNLSTCRLKGSN